MHKRDFLTRSLAISFCYVSKNCTEAASMAIQLLVTAQSDLQGETKECGVKDSEHF